MLECLIKSTKEVLIIMYSRRLKRVFRRDGRSLIVAFDHGLTEGPAKGLEVPEKTLSEIVAGGADAILTSYGIATRFADEIASLGLILRLDVGGTKIGKMGPGTQYFRIEDALRIGADAVAMSAFPGTPQEAATLQALAAVISEAHAWGLPVMAEMQPGGFDAGPESATTENVAISARIAAELGADWVKVPFTDDFNRVTETCFVPVVMLGGVKTNHERTLLEVVGRAMKEGASGVAIGRNIFQAEDPDGITQGLAAIIHEGASVDAAYSLYQRALARSST
jgi:class I fructose-bisphosphate aldolase